MKLVKQEAPGKKTLAVGDGANDVSMIVNADIGIGILSKEGNQASSFADYSMADFQSLRRLLFWHGRPMMVKIQNMILWIVFKACLFTFMVFWVNIQNGMSGHMPVETLTYASSKVALTTFAVSCYVVFEQDVSFNKYGTSLKAESKLPFHMSQLFASSFASSKRFLLNNVALTIYAFVGSCFIYLVFYQLWISGGLLGSDGKTFGLFTYGLVVPIC